MLSVTDSRVRFIAFLGLPDALSAPFSPKKTWDMIFPYRMICMYSLAYPIVFSLAPKKKSIGSRKMSATIMNRNPMMMFSVTILFSTLLAAV